MPDVVILYLQPQHQGKYPIVFFFKDAHVDAHWTWLQGFQQAWPNKIANKLEDIAVPWNVCARRHLYNIKIPHMS